MTLVTPEFKDGIQKLFERLSSPDDPAASMGPTIATARMTGPQTSEAKFPDFTLRSDEPKSVGGNDSAPPPSSIFVASTGFAENVIFARQAALHGLDFGPWRPELRLNGTGRGCSASATRIRLSPAS
jgi:hypothetical protein